MPAVTTNSLDLVEGDELIDVAHVPNGDRLRLVRTAGEFVILLDAHELMSTDLYASEEALATMACEKIGTRSAPQILIGGYGMGFTLRAALAVLGEDASVTVAEIVPKIIDWARGPMKAWTSGCLDDARVQLVQDDVALLIHAANGAYDAILLDVDNGPEGLTRRANDWLYSRRGLEAAISALKPQGILAIWSATPDAEFVAILSQMGFAVTVVPVEARTGNEIGGNELEHVILFAEVLP
jgi:spermidine synthase